jgi:hypothetical protein
MDTLIAMLPPSRVWFFCDWWGAILAKRFPRGNVAPQKGLGHSA